MPTEAYALCPMPYALCPMPYARRVPHVIEKGYILSLLMRFDARSVNPEIGNS